MLRITLAQMRRSSGRLAAAGIAIVIGTAFVAATLLAGDVVTRTTYDSIAARYADADLVVGATIEDPVTDVAALGEVDGVDSVAPMSASYAELSAGARSVFQTIIPTADDRLMPMVATVGAMPTQDDEIALPQDVAERLGVETGERVNLNRSVPAEDGSWEQVTVRPVVVGILDDPYGAYSQTGGAAVVDADTFATWRAEENGGEVGAEEVAVAVSPGADVAAVQAALATAVGGTTDPEDARWVVPTDERAATVAASLTGGQDLVFLIFVLTFAAIALVVAGLVIANTFQVLVAQRARTLALLRCVGANKAQVGRGVLTEAAILGAVASVAGVLLGTALGQGALWVAGAMDLPVPLPDSITLTWQVVVIPVLVGTLVTVGAALVPARVATRVAPLAALRPADAPSASRRAGRVRLVLSMLTAVLGFALLGLGAALGTVAQEPTFGVLAGIAGGALSFVGVAVGAVFWLPKVAALAGRLVGASGPTARLASANTLRNPRRTATTSTALLIGVTLVAMMSTGAASARTSLTSALDEQFPVDVEVSSSTYDEEGARTALSDGLRADVSSVADVAAITDLTDVSLGVPDIVDPDGEPVSVDFTALDPGAAREVLNAPDHIDGLAPGTALLGYTNAESLELADGDRLTLTGADGTATFSVAVNEVEPYVNYLAADDLPQVQAGTVVTDMYVALADSADAAGTVATIQDVVSDSGESAQVTGIAVQRAMYDEVIDTVLAIVLGLLAVAVVIALIGVANTLSLSVIERRKESATLRAIGLSKSQLRGMLAIEGLLIAGVGAVLGIVLGLVYGWGGSAAALGIMGDVTLTVPWLDVTLVLVVALAAGLVASVAPARTALKASPVEALAAD
ncbi:ABC transporter permease [Isoptericola sp. S6320L]|uniref:ABC transporter permease n=1 Tax=Isoptericola sp. S6320L TaxID=2926411 RepID=UPI001FF5FAAD|nr:ABC transporter permease [Isoptericola sp. S6320L]MCK0117804.1 ABC transporter permease [Isoptericola sp. S6320L]